MNLIARQLAHSLVLAIAVIVPVACTAQPPTEVMPPDWKVSSPAQAFKLSQHELIALQRRAMAGDGAAADSLANHFAFGRNMGDEATKWALIAAENGYAPAFQWLSVLMEAKGTDLGCLRAIFWLEKYEKTPEGRASETSAELKRLREKCPFPER